MDLNEIREDRIKKAHNLREAGINPYPYKFKATHTSEDIIDNFAEYEDKVSVKIAGRFRLIRRMGKASFADIHDRTGKMQLYIRKDIVGEDAYAAFKQMDLGDIVGVEGVPFKTQTGEITVKVKTLTILTKSIRPLSDKWKGLKNKEMRYRQRYLDMIMNPGVKKVFETRTKMLYHIREYLNKRGYLEVETPILQPLYGGALARPFITHHNSLDMELYLRVADELYLKRLIVGGMDKVYEVCKDFRNEGMDRMHNPEFSMIELYEAYADYNDMMDLIEEMLVGMCDAILGSRKITYQDEEINLSPPWKREKYFALIEKYTGEKIIDMTDDELRIICKKIAPDDKLDGKNRGQLIDLIFSEAVEPNLNGPIFVVDFPREISPLTKVHRDNPEKLVERFEIYMFRFEIANAYSELNDPLDQRKRFEEQVRWGESGDEETQPMDEDFLRALEYGMPPTGGMGIGFDRLAMIFTDQPSIRDVILFPQLRPEETDADEEFEEDEE